MSWESIGGLDVGDEFYNPICIWNDEAQIRSFAFFLGMAAVMILAISTLLAYHDTPSRKVFVAFE